MLLSAVMASAPLHAQTRPTTQPSPRLTVAILDFDTTGTNTPEMGKQIAEALMATLSSEEGFRLVDRSSFARTLQENELSLTGLAKPEDATRVGQLVGAKLLITGKAFTLDKNIYITAKIIGTETTLVDGVLVKDKQDADLGTLVTQLSSKLADRIRTRGPSLLAPGEPVDPIPALKARLATHKLPKLMVDLTETHYGEVRAHPIDPAVETEMESVLKQLGFDLVDDHNINLTDRGVDQILKGEAFSEFGAHVADLVSCSARVEIKLTDRSTSTVLFTDRVTTRAADLSEKIAAKTALQKAGHELALRLAEHYLTQATTQKFVK